MKFCKICGKSLNQKIKKYCSYSCKGKDGWMAKGKNKGEQSPSWNDSIISKEKLIDLYWNKSMSMRQIYTLFHTSSAVINRRFKLWNIKKRTHAEMNKIRGLQRRNINSQKGNRKCYLELAKRFKDWKCEKCGKTETNKDFDLIVHHKDRNNKNNQLSNLMILCQGCHATLHRTGQKFVNGYK